MAPEPRVCPVRGVCHGGETTKPAQPLSSLVIASPADCKYSIGLHGAVAQLGERRVRNAKVGSSILLRSTRMHGVESMILPRFHVSWSRQNGVSMDFLTLFISLIVILLGAEAFTNALEHLASA